jgi:hypothetical protein
LPGKYKLNLLLNCRKIFNTSLAISNITRLTILNITLGNVEFDIYSGSIGLLNKYGLFCSEPMRSQSCMTKFYEAQIDVLSAPDPSNFNENSKPVWDKHDVYSNNSNDKKPSKIFLCICAYMSLYYIIVLVHVVTSLFF